MDEKFDASRYLTSIKGKDYLPVAARLLWLRHEHPDASIETELLTFTADIAVARTTVRIPNGGSATGYGSETPQGFPDYLERAETRAIGRALGALGFGTQFCTDFEEGEHVAESPVSRPARAPQPARVAQADTERERRAAYLRTEVLIGKITEAFGVGRVDRPAFERWFEERHGEPYGDAAPVAAHQEAQKVLQTKLDRLTEQVKAQANEGQPS